MAVTKTLITAIPYNLNSKVQKWDLGMTYTEGTEGESDYYESTFNVIIPATDPTTGDTNFTPKAEGSWTLSELTGLCPTSMCDGIFAIQYDSVITTPPDDPLPAPDYIIPS